MRKKRIYLDTSIISHLLQMDVEEKRQDTLKFWEILQQGTYTVYISDITIEEVACCPEPKRGMLFDLLHGLEYTSITTYGSEEIDRIAAELIAHKALPPSSKDDALHLAAALCSDCDLVASWNFKHLVNARAVEGVRVVALLNNLRAVDIYSPTMLIDTEE
jgi:predicted nucleic acid-binding protein